VWVSCSRLAELAEQAGSTEARDWWRIAFDKISEMKQHGALAPADEHFIEEYRRKLSTPAPAKNHH
jgi:hypothetical protein